MFGRPKKPKTTGKIGEIDETKRQIVECHLVDEVPGGYVALSSEKPPEPTYLANEAEKTQQRAKVVFRQHVINSLGLGSK